MEKWSFARKNGSDSFFPTKLHFSCAKLHFSARKFIYPMKHGILTVCLWRRLRLQNLNFIQLHNSSINAWRGQDPSHAEPVGSWSGTRSTADRGDRELLFATVQRLSYQFHINILPKFYYYPIQHRINNAFHI